MRCTALIPYGRLGRGAPLANTLLAAGSLDDAAGSSVPVLVDHELGSRVGMAKLSAGVLGLHAELDLPDEWSNRITAGGWGLSLGMHIIRKVAGDPHIITRAMPWEVSLTKSPALAGTEVRICKVEPAKAPVAAAPNPAPAAAGDLPQIAYHDDDGLSWVGSLAEYRRARSAMGARAGFPRSESLWALLPGVLAEMQAAPPAGMPSRERIETFAFDSFSDWSGSKKTAKAVGVVGIYGVLGQHPGMWNDTSTERVGAQLKAMLAAPEVGSIVLEINSPGGSVFGVTELAAQLRAARDVKPIIASVNSMAGSAAYWIGAQASEIVVTPGGEVGSIGVFGVHWDQSKFLDMAGVKPTIISAGKFKTEGHGFGPLGDDARAYQQSRVDEIHNVFLSDVAKGRRVSPATVLTGFGEGRMVGASRAVSMGMADRVGTFEDAVRRAGGLTK